MYWKRICQVKEELKNYYTEAELSNMPRYSIQGECNMGFNGLFRLNAPKHRFFSWLTVQSKLQTTESMARIGISISDPCLICNGSTETHTHLFFQCQFIEQ